MNRIFFILVCCTLPSVMGCVTARAKKNLPVSVAYRPSDSQVPLAFLVMFPGGKGFLYRKHSQKFTHNFLLRSQKLFSAFSDVVVVGPPKDRKAGHVDESRTSPIHLRHVEQVIEEYNRKGLPVFLVGTSRGTLSAAYLAKSIEISGLILTASLGGRLTELGLHRFPVSTLLVHHEKDTCRVSRYSEAKKLSKGQANVIFEKVVGGHAPLSKNCQARSFHGFWGSEEMAIKTIENWIRKTLKPESP